MKRTLGTAALAVLLSPHFAAAATPAPKAGFVTPPSVTIAHWRNNATAAYSILHDDACDGSIGPPAHGTYGLFDHWQEAAQRGLRIALGTTTLECTNPPAALDFLRATLASGYEIFSHSWFHCDHTLGREQCEVWSDAAGQMLPLNQVYPQFGLDTREKLVDFEMQHSKAWLADRGNAGASPDFYSFPYDIYDEFAISRLAAAGYLGGRGGNRAAGNINNWHINPDVVQGGDPLVDFRVTFDEYNAADTLGNPQNTSDYDPPSLANYLAAVANGGLGGWGVQVLHGIEDVSFGTVALDLYRSHLDSVRALQDQGKLWVATPTEAIRYRRTNYHCGLARSNADAVISVDANGNLGFPGLADPACPAYATEVTLVVTLPAGVDAVTATQNGNVLQVRADATPGKVQVTANPVLGTINLQPVASPAGPAITSAPAATFAVGALGTFTATATGNPAPTFAFNGTLPPGLALNGTTGVLSGTPVAAGSLTRTLIAANGVAPDATQSFTITINKGTQSINFTAIDGLNVTEVDALLATSSSGLAVTFASSTPSVCSVSSENLTVTGLAPGICILQAAQAGDANWNPATGGQSFLVKGSQSIVFGTAPVISVGTTGTVTATASSGLPVVLTSWIPEICTISGNVVTGRAGGDCIIAANQPGNDFYHQALQVIQSFPVAKAQQVLSFGVAPQVIVGGVGTVNAFSSSGLTVALASSTPGTCSITGNVVTGVAVGNCTIIASQPGDVSYQPAANATQTFAIGPNSGSFSLVVANIGDGQGSVSSSPQGIACGASCAANFAEGASVVLTALPVAGSTFAGWSGACTGLGTCQVTMDAPKSVWATFTLFASLPRLAGLSTRGPVSTGSDVMIGGFVISGTTPKTVVVRAVGPSLAAHGVQGALAGTRLDLYSGANLVASNDDWQQAANAATLSSSGYAPADVRESALLMTLNPGAYTAIVSGEGGSTGVGLVEVFDLDPNQGPLVGISTRGQVLTGDQVLIGGFVIQGDAPKTVMIRARGPSLVPAGVPNALTNPLLQLFAGASLVATNDDWGSAPNANELVASGFAPADTREAAILVTLNPGAYTAIVRGVDGATGVALVEDDELLRETVAEILAASPAIKKLKYLQMPAGHVSVNGRVTVQTRPGRTRS